MAYFIDGYFQTKTKKKIKGKWIWVVSRPLPGPFVGRLKDGWLVVIGKADAVRFHKQ